MSLFFLVCLTRKRQATVLTYLHFKLPKRIDSIVFFSGFGLIESGFTISPPRMNPEKIRLDAIACAHRRGSFSLSLFFELLCRFYGWPVISREMKNVRTGLIWPGFTIGSIERETNVGKPMEIF
jgi:hypothetical protein